MTSRAIAGVDLLIDLQSSRGLRAGLEDALRDAVRTERLAAGTRLPSSRQLASDLGIARNTVAEAFTQLVAEGYLQSRAGSGTTVAPQPASSATPRASTTVQDSPASGPRLDLRPGLPDLSLFPRSAWASAMRSVLARVPHTALGYGDPRGTPELRSTLARYLARTRGVQPDAARIVVCAGYTQAIDLLLRVGVQRGATRMIAESPGLTFRTPETVSAHGVDLVPLPVDAAGARTDLLEDLAGGQQVAATVLTPAHQFPTGCVLAPERRAMAVQWAQYTGTLLVEDDYDGEFRYDRAPVGAMQGLAPDHVAYVGTASKALAPGLRLAWAMLPAQFVDAVVDIKRGVDQHAPILDQLTLAEVIDNGSYDRQIRRARLTYQQRRQQLGDVLASLTGIDVVGKSAGLQTLVRLPPGSTKDDEQAVIDDAAARGLALAGLAEHSDPTQHLVWGPGLVVGYATPPSHGVDDAYRVLRTVLKRQCRTSLRGGR